MPAFEEQMTDVPETTPTRTRKPKPDETTDDFADEFAALALGLPPSIRKAAVVRLKAKNVDPLEPADEKASALVKADLEAAIVKYALKAERARLASAARRLAKNAGIFSDAKLVKQEDPAAAAEAEPAAEEPAAEAIE